MFQSNTFKCFLAILGIACTLSSNVISGSLISSKKIKCTILKLENISENVFENSKTYQIEVKYGGIYRFFKGI